MLTTVEIRSIKPAARPFKVRDDKGLFLLVQPSGALLWRFRYKASGVERKLSLGSFPEVTLKQAREKRDAARAQLIDGTDPVAEKRQRRIEVLLQRGEVRAAAVELKEAGLSLRDIGRLLGVSFQRAGQLVA